MKYLVFIYHTFSHDTLIGVSNLTPEELFKVLKEEYPGINIRHREEYVDKEGWINSVFLDENGKDDMPYDNDYIYFTERNLREFK